LTKKKTPFILVALFLVQKSLVTLITSFNLPIISYTYVFATNINFCAYLFLPWMGSYAPSLSSNSCASRWKHGKVDCKCSLQHKWKVVKKYALIYWTLKYHLVQGLIWTFSSTLLKI